MKHRVKLTVIDKKLYPELQQQYCADPNAGACPCYNIGDEFIFERDGDRDFWMTSDEARAYGMIDDVLARKK